MENLRVPDSIKIAMQKAIMEFWRSNDEEIILPRDILPVIDSISRAFAISLSENPIVPNEIDVMEILQERVRSHHISGEEYCAIPPATVRFVIREWQRRMFLAPEPEVPEAIKDLLLDGADFIHGQRHADEANKQILEAYRRGQMDKA